MLGVFVVQERLYFAVWILYSIVKAYLQVCNRQVKTVWAPCVNNESLCVYLPKLRHQRELHTVHQPV